MRISRLLPILGLVCVLADAPVRSAELPTTSDPGWFAFDPPLDSFKDSAIDLRFLNERIAGDHGFIKSQGDQFVRSMDGQAMRFWAVNGPPGNESGDDLRKTARLLAKRGVNLVRVHGP